MASHAQVYPLTDFTLSFVDWGEGNPGSPGVTLELGEKARAIIQWAETIDVPQTRRTPETPALTCPDWSSI
jgi:hypothetical protein